jgi:parvulin-like peptidyl-prolyl isomerase
MAATRLTFLAAALAAASLVALSAVPAPARAQMQAYGDAARVNGSPISMERLERNFDEYLREKQVNIAAMRSPQRAARMKREVLDLLVDQELLLQEAQRRHIEASAKEAREAVANVRAGFQKPELFDQRLVREGFTLSTYEAHVQRMLAARKLLDAVNATVSVTDDEVAGFIREHAADFVTPEERRLRHLYVPFGSGIDDAGKAAAREKVAALLRQARAGTDFATLVREHSRGSSADRGGDIGYVQRHELAQPLAEAAFTTAQGAVSEMVELPDGVHLLQVDDVKAATPLPETLVKERVRAQLRSKAAETARAELVKQLRAEAKVQVLIPLPSSTTQPLDERSPAQRARAVMN